MGGRGARGGRKECHTILGKRNCLIDPFFFALAMSMSLASLRQSINARSGVSNVS